MIDLQSRGKTRGRRGSGGRGTRKPWIRLGVPSSTWSLALGLLWSILATVFVFGVVAPPAIHLGQISSSLHLLCLLERGVPRVWYWAIAMGAPVGLALHALLLVLAHSSPRFLHASSAAVAHWWEGGALRIQAHQAGWQARAAALSFACVALCFTATFSRITSFLMLLLDGLEVRSPALASWEYETSWIESSVLVYRLDLVLGLGFILVCFSGLAFLLRYSPYPRRDVVSFVTSFALLAVLPSFGVLDRFGESMTGLARAEALERSAIVRSVVNGDEDSESLAHVWLYTHGSHGGPYRVGSSFRPFRGHARYGQRHPCGAVRLPWSRRLSPDALSLRFDERNRKEEIWYVEVPLRADEIRVGRPGMRPRSLRFEALGELPLQGSHLVLKLDAALSGRHLKNILSVAGGRSPARITFAAIPAVAGNWAEPLGSQGAKLVDVDPGQELFQLRAASPVIEGLGGTWFSSFTDREQLRGRASWSEEHNPCHDEYTYYMWRELDLILVTPVPGSLPARVRICLHDEDTVQVFLLALDRALAGGAREIAIGSGDSLLSEEIYRVAQVD